MVRDWDIVESTAISCRSHLIFSALLVCTCFPSLRIICTILSLQRANSLARTGDTTLWDAWALPSSGSFWFVSSLRPLLVTFVFVSSSLGRMRPRLLPSFGCRGIPPPPANAPLSSDSMVGVTLRASLAVNSSARSMPLGICLHSMLRSGSLLSHFWVM
jgi:hypothetical protein